MTTSSSGAPRPAARPEPLAPADEVHLADPIRLPAGRVVRVERTPAGDVLATVSTGLVSSPELEAAAQLLRGGAWRGSGDFPPPAAPEVSAAGRSLDVGVLLLELQALAAESQHSGLRGEAAWEYWRTAIDGGANQLTPWQSFRAGIAFAAYWAERVS